MDIVQIIWMRYNDIMELLITITYQYFWNLNQFT